MEFKCEVSGFGLPIYLSPKLEPKFRRESHF